MVARLANNRVIAWSNTSLEDTAKSINRSNSAKDCFQSRFKILKTSAKLIVESSINSVTIIASIPATLTIGWFSTCNPKTPSLNENETETQKKSFRTKLAEKRIKLAKSLECISLQTLITRIVRLAATLLVMTLSIPFAFLPLGGSVVLSLYEKTGLVKKKHIDEKEPELKSLTKNDPKQKTSQNSSAASSNSTSSLLPKESEPKPAEQQEVPVVELGLPDNEPNNPPEVIPATPLTPPPTSISQEVAEEAVEEYMKMIDEVAEEAATIMTAGNQSPKV